jgi:hypothetical protein
VFGSSGSNRTLTGFFENGTTATVRTAAFTGGNLVLTLATFTPSVSASSNATLNWDVSASTFSVNVNNPADILDQYVSEVASVASISGNVSTTLANYSAGSKSATPAGGIDWTQTFTVNNSTSYIRSASTTASGGSAIGRVTFNYFNGTSTATWTSTADFTVNWNSVGHSISLDTLTGKTFLQTYTSAAYETLTSGLANTANRTFTVSGTNGTPSNTSGSGTLTFTTPIHKTNASSTTTRVTLSTVCSRPVNVTGTAYSVTLGPINSDNVNATADFEYPSFHIWTSSTAVKPSRADVVDDSSASGFAAGISRLGDQVNVLSTQPINNTDSNPRAFWFAVRDSAIQPTSFKTGANASLLSTVSVLDGGTIALQPDNPPAGYVAENYRIWGITLQTGTTYVSIS